MQTIFISATSSDSGQTLLSWFLARALIDRGRVVSLFRPMGVRGPSGRDPAMELLSEALEGKISGPCECPVLIDPEGGVDPDLAEFYYKKIDEQFKYNCAESEVCLTIGSRDVFFDAEQSSLPDIRFIEMFNARVILIDRFQTTAMTVYSTLALASFLRDRLAGIVINRVPGDAWESFYGKTVPMLKSKGVPILAVLAEDDVLGNPTIQDLAEMLEAEVLSGSEKLNQIAVGSTISAQDLPKSMKIYKRVVNKIILIGGSLDQVISGEKKHVCGIILTGGRSPAPQVVEAAQKEGIPVLLTGHDTFAAIDAMGNEKRIMRPRDLFRLDRFEDLILRQISLEEILKACEV